MRPALRGAGRTVLNLVVVVAALLLAWTLLVSLHHDSTGYVVTRRPQDVYDYLFTGIKHHTDAAENRSTVFSPLGVTLKDAGLGFVVGLVVAFVVATGIVLSRGAEAAVMPVAMVLRSVPLVALAPILIIMFGFSTAIAAVMSGIVVLFPALVIIVFGLRSVTPQMSDIVHVYGGGTRQRLLRVAFPSALPSIFAALRISVPGAMTGALLAEDLGTGQGLGHAVGRAAAEYQYDPMWAMVVVITVISVLLYMLAQLLERLVLARFAMSDNL